MSPQTKEMPLLLLVDDTPANLHLLASSLKGEYRIKTATNGLSAIEIARRSDRPDLILLDMMMPGMSGIEVLDRLRSDEATSSIPVIFVTADTSEQSQIEGLELGAHDYLTKPLSIVVLKTRVKLLLQRLQLERERLLAAHVFNHSGEAIIITDSDSRIIEVNPAFTLLTGYKPEEVKGRKPGMLSAGRTPPKDYQAMWEAINRCGFWQGELWNRRRDGSSYPVLLTVSKVPGANGNTRHFIGTFNDITVQKKLEAEIRHLANHDHLTGLPNRAYVQIALEQAAVAAKRDNSSIALLFLDLDNFKVINDTFGHAIGDELLIQVGERLKECVRESDLVARLGGDEFLVLMLNHLTLEGVETVARKIIDHLSHPFALEGNHLICPPSIGISIYPKDTGDMQQLMKNADIAMYQVKKSGRGSFRFFTHDS